MLNNTSPFENLERDRIEAKKKREMNLKIKNAYTNKLIDAINNIVSDFNKTRYSEFDWVLNPADKINVLNYYNKYWSKNFFNLSLVLVLISFIISFYTEYSILGIFIVFLLKMLLSEGLFFRYFIHKYELDNEERKIIKTKIFGKQLNILNNLMITIILIFISLFAKSHTYNFLINFEDNAIIYKFLSNWHPFIAANELFAFAVISSIFLIMILKRLKR